MLVRTGKELIKEINKIVDKKDYIKNYKTSMESLANKGRKISKKLFISTFKEIINT